MSNPEADDNVTYIDEHNRERWLLKLRIARAQGQVAVFGAMQPKPADILPIDMHPRYEPHFDTEGA